MNKPQTPAALPIAALAAAPAPHTTERYAHIDSREVVRLMEQEGWHVAAASSVRPRTRDPLYAKHSIDFRHADAQPHFGAAPRVVFTNSHDGSSSAQALAGYFRFVCDNGLIIGRETARVRARHTGLGAATFVHDAQRLLGVLDAERRTFDTWTGIQLTAPQRAEYARLVGQLRWGDAYAYDAAALLSVRREEDDDGSLLTTFNRAQENTTRGGLRGLNRNGRQIVSQPIASIDRDLHYNAQLWQLTEEFAEVVA